MSEALGRIRLGVAVLGALLGGCVSSQTYQKSQIALDAERAALARARSEQQALRARVAELSDELAAARSRLSEQEQRVEQSELASSVARQARDRIASLVDQLREELGRAGDHLRAFSAEKRELRQALARVTETHPGARLEVRLPQGSHPESEQELRQGLQACGLGEQSFVVVAQADPGAAELGQPRSEVLVAEPAH